MAGGIAVALQKVLLAVRKGRDSLAARVNRCTEGEVRQQVKGIGLRLAQDLGQHLRMDAGAAKVLQKCPSPLRVHPDVPEDAMRRRAVDHMAPRVVAVLVQGELL